jgi:hypothetical protein
VVHPAERLSQGWIIFFGKMTEQQRLNLQMQS